MCFFFQNYKESNRAIRHAPIFWMIRPTVILNLKMQDTETFIPANIKQRVSDC